MSQAKEDQAIKNQEFLESYDINQYDRPSIAADIAVFSIGTWDRARCR